MALTTSADYQSFFNLSEEELLAFKKSDRIFQIRTTPYYAQLTKILAPVLTAILTPHLKEFDSIYQEQKDPLAENANSPVSRIIHRYPDRALFLITDFCSVYCRFCTRKHFTASQKSFPKKSEYEKALGYLKNNSQIREVILSGGDPLTLSNEKIKKNIR